MEEKITCPLVDDWISPVDCMENQTLKEESIPEPFKKKENWREICKKLSISRVLILHLKEKV